MKNILIAFALFAAASIGFAQGPPFNSSTRTVQSTQITPRTGTGSVVLGTSPTITTPNVVGTATNDSAAAGSVGEAIEGTGSVSIGSSVTNVASIVLTAGDWNISATVSCTSGTATYLVAGISTANNTLGSADGKSVVVGPAVASLAFASVRYRLSIAAGATYYLNANVSSTNTCAGVGYVLARRMR